MHHGRCLVTFVDQIKARQPAADTGHVAISPPAAFRVEDGVLRVWVDGRRLTVPLEHVREEQYPPPMFAHGPLTP